MALRIIEKRVVGSVEDLEPLAREQLAIAGRMYDGDELTAEQRLADDGSETSFAGHCDRYKVVEGDKHLYDAWFLMVDSGSFFRAGTTDEIAGIIQFGLECEDKSLADQLGPAMVEAGLLPPADGSYARFKKLLDAQQSRS